MIIALTCLFQKLIMKLPKIFTILLVSGAAVTGQTFTVLHSFGNGRPLYSMVLDGNTLYGTMTEGNTVFKMNIDGSGFDVVYYNGSNDFRNPTGIILDGKTLYGTTEWGNSSNSISGAGTVFKVDTDGSNYEVLKFFTTNDGYHPVTELVLGGTNLYGTTTGGGSNSNGTVFKIDTDGSGFAVLYHFGAGYTNDDGAGPLGGLTLSGNTLFGTAGWSGPGSSGTVFRMNTDGSDFTVLHSFSRGSNYTNVDGAYPYAAMLLVGDTLYGTTSSGGTSGFGTVFKINTNGSDFTVLHSLSNGAPATMATTGRTSGVITDGKFLYGTVANGGPGMGFLYRLTMDGSGYYVLHNFGTNGPPSLDGRAPEGGLVLANGALFGTTSVSGSGNAGTFFSLQLNDQPVISSATQGDGTVVLSWNTLPGNVYQVQFTTELSSGAWANLGETLTATDYTLSATNTIGSVGNGFYRVALLIP
jgi:uncharacterized repeat protein (TIGR03803 family)